MNQLTYEQIEQIKGDDDFRTLKAYARLRAEVTRMFTDPMRRKRVEAAAGLKGIAIPNSVLKGIG